MNKQIAVIGAPPQLPASFPINFSENSGNMIHANAPNELFGRCIHVDYFRSRGGKDFIGYVNENCSHLIVTFANTLRLGVVDGSRFSRLQAFLEKVKIPVVPFGLGVQSKDADLDAAVLPSEAISLLNYLGNSAPAIGVRGDFTRSVVERLSNARNLVVTGCPSFFTRPASIRSLSSSMISRGSRVPASSWTNYHNSMELDLFCQSIKGGYYHVEPVNKFNHEFYLKSLSMKSDGARVPYFFKYRGFDVDVLLSHFRVRYKLFRGMHEWYMFNSEHVDFTYGTRFHVNMASVLAGRPALWLTHDARTQELVDLFKLPSMALEDFHKSGGCPAARDVIGDKFESKIFLENYEYRLNIFREYLARCGLSMMSEV